MFSKKYNINKIIDNPAVLNIISRNLKVKEKEKDLYGEVFTPIELIFEMLDKLYSNVWSNPKLVWLDPSCGIGNFPIVIYYKLMNGLKKKISNPQTRSKHIINNMLYMVELNPKNTRICKKIFKLIDKNSSPNIFKINFFKFNPSIQFDVIIGNPPYNQGSVRAMGKKLKDGETAETIWPNFVRKSLGHLRNKKSYLLFIHPASWISLSGGNKNISATILDKQIIYLKYYTDMQALKLFGGVSGQIPLTYYLLKNENIKQETNIYDVCFNKWVKYNIYKNLFIPTQSVKLTDKLLKIIKKYGNLSHTFISGSAITTSEISHRKTNYPLVSIINKDIVINYSKINHNKDNDRKLVVTNSRMIYPLYDDTGNLYYIKGDKGLIKYDNNKKKLIQIRNYLYTDFVCYLITITKTRQAFFNKRVFEILPDITKMTNKTNITDELLKDIFKLTKTDLKCIELYKNTGDGMLTSQQIRKFKNF